MFRSFPQIWDRCDLETKSQKASVFKTFLEKIMSLDFLALNVTLHFLAQYLF